MCNEKQATNVDTMTDDPDLDPVEVALERSPWCLKAGAVSVLSRGRPTSLSASCPLSPWKRTPLRAQATSVSGHKRTSSPSRRLDCQLGPGARNGRADH